MKQKNLMIVLTVLMSMAVGCMTLMSCGDDDVAPSGGGGNTPGKNAEQNTTDVAVTGEVSDINTLYAKISGVVNLDVITASYTNVKIGVEVSTTQDFANKQRTEAADVVGRKFSVYVFLQPSTKYYYRTYVSVSSLSYDYYGETYSFSTKNGSSAPLAVTGDVEEIEAYEVQINGKANLTDVDAVGATATVGIEVSENSDFSKPKRVTAGNPTDEFCLHFTQLNPNRKHYYRTFVEAKIPLGKGIYYGEAKTFTTLDYVDLGLPSGTLWAICNIGAANPEDYGDYFAWGETEPYYSVVGNDTIWKEGGYVWNNYKYCSSDEYMTKYVHDDRYGTIDNKWTLESDDDAATVNWGGSWRMPTNDELEELLNAAYCTQEATTVNGVSGRKFTSVSNGNSIFFPFAGSIEGIYLRSLGTSGDSWTSSLASADTKEANCFSFWNASANNYTISSRYIGMPVRAVHPAE